MAHSRVQQRNTTLFTNDHSNGQWADGIQTAISDDYKRLIEKR
tara:strand:- start:227 stop:355 length:129 start_codon:yes stop_codon:yes gene_type:complete